MVTTNNKQNCPNSTFVTQKGIQFILDLPKVAVITTLIPLHSKKKGYNKKTFEIPTKSNTYEIKYLRNQIPTKYLRNHKNQMPTKSRYLRNHKNQMPTKSNTYEI